MKTTSVLRRYAFWASIGAMLFAIGLFVPAAHASGLSLCPLTGSFELASAFVPSLDVNGGTLGTASNALGTATATPSSDSATAVYDDGESVANSGTEYCFAVVGPAGTAVIDVTGSVSVSFTNPESSDETGISIPSSSCNLQYANSDPSETQYLNPTYSCTVDTNTSIDIDLYAIARAIGSGTASASVDPYITIDPSQSNADEYSVEVSAGVDNSPAGAAPEPSSAVLMLTGIGLLAVMWKLRSNRMVHPISASEI